MSEQKPESIKLASELEAKEEAIPKNLAEGVNAAKASEEKEPQEAKSQDPESEEEVLQDSEEEEKEDEEVEEEVEPKPKKKSGFQRRVDKLNSKISAMEQEKEYWRQEALRTKESGSKPTPASEPKADPKKPKAEEFASHDEYVEALTEWKLEKKLIEREQKQKEESIKSEVQSRVQKHRERVDEFAASKDDWEEVTEVFNKSPLTITFQDVILESEIGPAILYELGKDQKELKRILSLTPLQTAKELGKIEARLSQKSTPQKEEKQTKTVPKPPNPVRSKGASVPKGFRPDMSLREYDEWRRNQEKR